MGEQPRRRPVFRHQLNRLFIERDKRFTAQPAALIGDNTVREIASGFQDREPSLSRRPVHHNVSRVQQISDRRRDIFFRQLSPPAQDPNQLA